METIWCRKAGLILTTATLLQAGGVRAQEAAPVVKRTPEQTAALIAPKNFKPSGHGAAYDRTGLFASKGRFPEVEAWLGRPIPYFTYFTGRASPEAMIAQARDNVLGSKVLQPLKGRVKLCIIIPLAFAPKNGLHNAKTPEGVVAVRGYLQETISGKHDKAYRETGRLLVQAGFPDAILRVGHEFSGRWYPWSAVENPELYAAAFRHVVTVMRSVSPDFTFDFNGSSQDFGLWAEKAYPGDAYVDIVGTDIYDRGLSRKYFSREKKGWDDPEKAWAEGFLPRLEAVRRFALAKGKPLSIPEWGIEGQVETGDGTEGSLIGGGDNAVFIRKFAEWMNNLPPAGPASLAYHSYFWSNPVNEGLHTLDDLPRAAAAYLQLFGNPEASKGFPAKPAPVKPAP